MTPLQQIAHAAHDAVLKHGADATAVSIGESRSVQVEWRSGALERIQDKTHRSLGIEIFVNGRYAGFSTNDFRTDALSKFLTETVDMTKLLEPDPHRQLASPPTDRPLLELDLYDASIAERQATDRLREMQHFDEVVQATLDDVPPVSYTTSVSDGWGSYYRLFSTGFSEASQTSTFAKSGTISLKDKDGKLPLGWDGTYARHLNDLLADDRLARTMLERAQHQLGARPIDTGRYDIIIVNRGMGKVLGPLLNPLRGSSIQQGRSLWKDRLNDQIVSKHLTIWDEPHRIRGLGSSQFDGDGFETCRRPLIENGRLKTFLINDYYARKLNCERTGADTHSLEWTLGSKDLSGLVGEVHNGLLIERFLGGNCNETTGNFSFGCAGRRIENGIITTPFAEANLSGQLETFWKSLRQIGNDPLEQSSNGAPSCLFAGAQVSGN